MEFNNEAYLDEMNLRSKQEEDKPKVWQVEDDSNLTEDDLQTPLIFDADDKKPVREGQPMGGENFGQNNITPARNDGNNPQQNAGITNPYFNRAEPMEEHPENSNFTAKEQDGQPDYSKAQPQSSATSDQPKPEKVERGNGENDRPHPQQDYTEGTADNEEVNIPGPNEVPDQQKVGEENDATDERDHIET